MTEAAHTRPSPDQHTATPDKLRQTYGLGFDDRQVLNEMDPWKRTFIATSFFEAFSTDPDHNSTATPTLLRLIAQHNCLDPQELANLDQIQDELQTKLALAILDLALTEPSHSQPPTFSPVTLDQAKFRLRNLQVAIYGRR